MAKAKKNTVKRTRTTSAKRRSTSLSASRRRAASRDYGRLALPLLVGIALVIGIGFFGLMGYRTAIASEFFNVKKIDVRGTERVNAEDVRRIVAANTEKTGVWRSDLSEIREKVEKLPFVKTAAVSMVLPYGVRVNVTERIPVAIVKLSQGEFLVDADGFILNPVAKAELNMPFVMRGWDETKTERSATDNLARLKIYKKMLDEWREFGLSDRVKEVNLADLKDPNATIQESGRSIPVSLSKDNLGKSLKSAVEAVAGKGEKVRAVNAGGVYPIIEYLSLQ